MKRNWRDTKSRQYIFMQVNLKTYPTSETSQPAKGYLTQVNNEATSFDRFLVYCIPSSPHVMISFLKPQQQRNNLRFSTHMPPGHPVYVIMPRAISYFSPQNPEFVASDSIIPVSEYFLLQLYTLHPADVGAPNFIWFDFVSNKIKVFTATAQDNICTGSFCEAQITQKIYPCTVSIPYKHW